MSTFMIGTSIYVWHITKTKYLQNVCVPITFTLDGFHYNNIGFVLFVVSKYSVYITA